MLSFSDKSGKNYPAPYLGTVALVCGYVIYRVGYEKVHEETFEEALRIVKQSQGVTLVKDVTNPTQMCAQS